jgi:hypothetical protein
MYAYGQTTLKVAELEHALSVVAVDPGRLCARLERRRTVAHAWSPTSCLQEGYNGADLHWHQLLRCRCSARAALAARAMVTVLRRKGLVSSKSVWHVDACACDSVYVLQVFGLKQIGILCTVLPDAHRACYSPSNVRVKRLRFSICMCSAGVWARADWRDVLRHAPRDERHQHGH